MKMEKTREALDDADGLLNDKVTLSERIAAARDEVAQAESLLRKAAALKVFAVAGLSAFHGRMCDEALDGPIISPDASRCRDPKCRAWAAAVQGETADEVETLRKNLADAQADNAANAEEAARLKRECNEWREYANDVEKQRDEARNAALEEAESALAARALSTHNEDRRRAFEDAAEVVAALKTRMQAKEAR